MLPREKTVHFLQKLHQASLRGVIDWYEHYDGMGNTDYFYCAFGQNQARIWSRWNGEADAFDYVFTLADENDRVMDESSDVVLHRDWSEAYTTMSELFELARSKATGAYEALDRMTELLEEKFSGSTGDNGTIADDEIPFD
jgi:hypothetical protein